MGVRKTLLDRLAREAAAPEPEQLLLLDPRFDDRIKEQARLRALTTTVDERGTQNPPGIPLADLEGQPFVTTMSDRTRAGGLLTHINQVPLRDPVNLQGGQGFMMENPGAVWASAPRVTRQQQAAAQSAKQATGQDPLFIPWRMAPSGQDFATMSGEAMLGYAASNLGKGAKRSFDARMKKIISGWPGLDSPDSVSAFRGASADARKTAKSVMDRDFRDRGGLGLGEARLAVADPDQRAARDGGIQNIGRTDPGAPIIMESGHPSYPSALPGEGIGRTSHDVGIYELMPDVARARGIADPLNPSPQDLRALQMKPYGGVITEEVLRNLVARGVDVSKPALVLGALGLAAAPEEAEAGVGASDMLRLLRERAREGVTQVGGESLPGAPNMPKIPGGNQMRVGQNPEAVRAAEQYAQRSGIPYTPLENYVQVDPERGSRIARAYERMPHNPDDPRTKASYKALADETLDQYESMLSAGVEPYFVRGQDPYKASPYLSLLDLAENKRLGVFPTDDGFGTGEAFDATGNPLLAESPFKIGGEPARVNDIFRAVHDFYGHAKPGVGFRAMGEENAYQSHAGMYSPEARPAAASETRGQNSWLNFGPNGENNRTAGIDETVFADQKTGLMPNWAVNEGLETVKRPPVSEALKPAVDERGMLDLTHYSRRELDLIDPSKYGTGLAGRSLQERQRTSSPDWVDRSYYGIDKGVERPYRPEQGLGNTANKAEIAADLLYDPKADPSGIWGKAKGGDDGFSGKEKAVRDAGFSGYWQDHPKLGKVAVVFDELEAKRLKQGGYAGPIMLAATAAAGGGLMGLLSALGEGQTAVADAESQGSTDAIMGLGNYGESLARDVAGMTTDAVTGNPALSEGIRSGQTLPPSAASGVAGELMGGLMDRLAPVARAAWNYDPPVGPPVKDQLMPLVDAWGELSEPVRTRLAGVAGLMGLVAPTPKGVKVPKKRDKKDSD